MFAINWLLAFVGLEIVAAKPESKEKGKRARKAATEASEDQELQGKFGDLDLSKYDFSTPSLHFLISSPPGTTLSRTATTARAS